MTLLKDKFTSSIKKLIPVDKETKFLLAVSGGMDSIVLADLFHQYKLTFGIAHCNFQLRDAESTIDETFVEGFAKKINVPFFNVRFNTAEYATAEALSIQMAARELRYEWFGTLCKENQYDYIVTAHHADDNAETMLLNLIKGKGLNALAGIPVVNQNIIRPLLSASQKEIKSYALENKLEWREDQSNQSTDYDRNYLRLKVIPLLKELNPSLEKTLSNTSVFFSEAATFIEQEIEKWKAGNVIERDQKTQVLNLTQLQHHPLRSNILFRLLSSYDFQPGIIRQVGDYLHAPAGTKFYSGSHVLVFDRNNFSIHKNEAETNEQLVIQRGIEKYEAGTSVFHFKSTLPAKEIFKNDNPNITYVDAGELIYPLLLRHWQEGDAFCPLGMQQSKKISDFFIDEKIPLQEKANIWLLTSNGEIVWVAGYRLDDRFKVSADTKTVLKITFAE